VPRRATWPCAMAWPKRRFTIGGQVGGPEVSYAKRLRALDGESAKLKRLLVETMLESAGLKDLLARNW
jgi:hypothetical protein